MSSKHINCIEFQDVTKNFGSLIANDQVSFSIQENSIHGVVGENGAGKSTIMKILYGLYPADSGKIFVRGKEVTIRHPQDAIKLGIGMVHQHFMLVPTLSVLENLILGSERSFFFDLKRIFHEIDTFQKEYGFNLPLYEKIESLPIGLQQQVEILKLLYRKADILILDEPTAVLTPQEVRTLFDRLNNLWEKGKTIILITHKLKEILSFTKEVTVLRQGKVIETIPTNTLDEESLAFKIVGRKVQKPPKLESKKSNTLLEVRNVSLERNNQSLLKNISFDLKAGEILGIAGISGNGQEALVEVLSQVEKKYSGQITFKGVDLRALSTYDLKRRGISIIAPDRQQESIVMDFSVRENYLLGQHWEHPFCQKGFLSLKTSEDETFRKIDEFQIRPRHSQVAISNLSGGNQQKLVIAREIHPKMEVLIAAYPTRGVDIGAIEFIHHYLMKEKEQGRGILLVSSELDEILNLSNRILVFFNGEITGEIHTDHATETQLGKWMTGAA